MKVIVTIKNWFVADYRRVAAIVPIACTVLAVLLAWTILR